MTNKRIHKLLIVAGSIIIFGSWVIENYLQKDRDTKLTISNNDVISLQTVRGLQMNSKFAYEYYRDRYYANTRDSSAIYNLAFFSTEHGITLLGEGQMYKEILNSDNADDLYKIDSVGHIYDSLLRYYHKTKNLDSLQDIISEIEVSYKPTNELEDRRRDVYFKLLDEAEQARIIFLITYITGSLLLGIAYLTRRD
jgi:hypothetical protein